jgi:phosphoethanolamine N-methyltransferase
MVHSTEEQQEFLDSAQYLTSSILQYEAVYGEGFISPGGRQMAIELIGQMGLAAGSRVLDVGCGLGGSAFIMAREYECQVDGIDLSKNMLALANAKLSEQGLTDRIKLEWGDCLELNRAEIYDAIYSRDVFLHIENKSRLFSVLKQSLRIGGQLLFTDYCCGSQPWSDEFTAYVEDRGYCLHTLGEYAELISGAGFEQVVYQDLTDRFVKILESDIETIAEMDLDQGSQVKLEQSWRQKVIRSQAGDHRWGLFTAIKGS